MNRRERRNAAKPSAARERAEDRARTVIQYFAKHTTLARWQVEDAMRQQPSAETAIKIGRQGSAFLVELSEKLQVENDVKVACEAGCNHCCKGPLYVTPPEAMAVADYVRTQLNAEDRAKVISGLRAQVAAIASGAKSSPCPLLDGEGFCRVYHVRPGLCVGVTGFDPKACEKGDTSGFMPQFRLAKAHQAGVVLGLSDAEIDARPVELSTAVLAILDDGGIAEEWAKGKPALERSTAPMFSGTWLKEFREQQGAMIPSAREAARNPELAKRVGVSIRQRKDSS